MRKIEMREVIDHRRRRLFGAAAATIAVARLGPIGSANAQARLPLEGELPSFGGATAWLNSAPLSAADLRGKVALVNFWTFTCINWLRQLPYVRAWAETYKEQGLVVIGVHTPEFTFEQNIDNVRRAAKDMNVGYPIAVDSQYAIWRAFNNQYWPALYLVDTRGKIRHHQLGEGEYEKSEKIIQELLSETGGGDIRRNIVSVDPRGIEAAADWGALKAPENYIGYARAESFASPGGIRKDVPNLYRTASPPPFNRWGLAGDWTIGSEYATLNVAPGRIAHRFHARDLHLVLTLGIQGRSIRFRVRFDGATPGADHGVDVDADGWGTVRDGRLYQLVRQTGPVAERTFEIEFIEDGVRAYAFTFG